MTIRSLLSQGIKLALLATIAATVSSLASPAFAQADAYEKMEKCYRETTVTGSNHGVYDIFSNRIKCKKTSKDKIVERTKRETRGANPLGDWVVFEETIKHVFDINNVKRFRDDDDLGVTIIWEKKYSDEAVQWCKLTAGLRAHKIGESQSWKLPGRQARYLFTRGDLGAVINTARRRYRENDNLQWTWKETANWITLIAARKLRPAGCTAELTRIIY